MTRCFDCGRRSWQLITQGVGSLEIHLCPPERLAKCVARRKRLQKVRNKFVTSHRKARRGK